MVAIIGFFILLISAFLPWINITPSLPSSKLQPSLFEIYSYIIHFQGRFFPMGEVTIGLYIYVFFMLMGLILYPISMLVGLISIAGKRPEAYTSSGILAIASGIFWAIGIEFMKGYMVSQMSVNLPIAPWIGTYMAIAAGFMFIIAGMLRPKAEEL